MVTFACVRTGGKYAEEYVYRLRDGIKRNLTIPHEHEFICFTPERLGGIQCEPLPADLSGWWSKIGLFKTGRPMIYFDLDVIITGNLDPLIEWDGFGIIKDWALPGFNSSVMKLTGAEAHVFDAFRPNVMSLMHGDQDWITASLPEARTFPVEWFPSLKLSNAFQSPPEGSLAVIAHGLPKPHQCGGWVKSMWHRGQ